MQIFYDIGGFVPIYSCANAAVSVYCKSGFYFRFCFEGTFSFLMRLIDCNLLKEHAYEIISIRSSGLSCPSAGGLRRVRPGYQGIHSYPYPDI